MTELQRYPSADLHKFRLVVTVGEESSSPRHSGDFLKHRTTKPGQRIVCRIGNSNRVNLHVSFLNAIAQFFVDIPAVVVLTIGNYQQRLFLLPTLLNFLDGYVSGVIK